MCADVEVQGSTMYAVSVQGICKLRYSVALDRSLCILHMDCTGSIRQLLGS